MTKLETLRLAVDLSDDLDGTGIDLAMDVFEASLALYRANIDTSRAIVQFGNLSHEAKHAIDLGYRAEALWNAACAKWEGK